MTLDTENVWMSRSDMKVLYAAADNLPDALFRLGLALGQRGLENKVIDLTFSLDEDGGKPLVGAVLEGGGL